MAENPFLTALQEPLYTSGETYSGIGAGAVAGALPALVDPYGSTGSNALNIFGGSILAALLGNMAKNDAAEENKVIATQQAQFLNSDPNAQLAMVQENPRVFSKLQAALNTQNMTQQMEDNALKRQLEIKEPYAIDAEERALASQIAQEKRALENNILQATDPRVLAAKDPNKISDRLVKEGETTAKLSQVNQYIDEKFDRAKQLTGKSAIVGMNSPFPTPEATELTGLKDSVLVQIDNALGREMNSDVRQRLLSLTPTSYDSAEVIETKKQNMKELLASLSAPTPLTDSLTKPKEPPAPPPGYELTGKVDASGNYGIRKIR